MLKKNLPTPSSKTPSSLRFLLTHTRAHTALLSLYKQTAAELTPSTPHSSSHVLNIQELYLQLQHACGYFCCSLCKTWSEKTGHLFSTYRVSNVSRKTRITERKGWAEQGAAASHPPHSHSKVLLLLQAVMLPSRAPPEAREHAASQHLSTLCLEMLEQLLTILCVYNALSSSSNTGECFVQEALLSFY